MTRVLQVEVNTLDEAETVMNKALDGGLTVVSVLNVSGARSSFTLAVLAVGPDDATVKLAIKEVKKLNLAPKA